MTVGPRGTAHIIMDRRPADARPPVLHFDRSGTVHEWKVLLDRVWPRKARDRARPVLHMVADERYFGRLGITAEQLQIDIRQPWQSCARLLRQMRAKFCSPSIQTRASFAAQCLQPWWLRRRSISSIYSRTAFRWSLPGSGRQAELTHRPCCWPDPVFPRPSTTQAAACPSDFSSHVIRNS